MVVVGTWNLENLYRPGGQFGPKTQAAYEAKLTVLAATITAANPDVLAVQEVGEPAALDDLVGRLPGTWHTSLSTHPDARGIRVGFLTHSAPTTTEQVVDFPAPLHPVQVGDAPNDVTAGMGRGALHIHLDDLGGHAWDLVTVHLKSKLLTFPGGRFNPTNENERARFAAYALYRRAAEAATVRVAATGILDGHGQDRRLVVLGDLNDTEQAATTQLLYGPPGSQYGTGGFAHPDRGDAQRLWNLAPQIPPEHRYSRIFEGQRELIDHILISHALLTSLQSVDTQPNQVASITLDPAARRDAPASDHAPVFAQFT
jgi:endonuclease/exonuclease/phosphatase family metal-dependent hydrolase